MIVKNRVKSKNEFIKEGPTKNSVIELLDQKDTHYLNEGLLSIIFHEMHQN